MRGRAPRTARGGARSRRDRGGARSRRAVVLVAVGAVAVKNRVRYGAAVITEFGGGPFPSAYAAIVRVRHAAPRARVPLPAEARRRIYAVSPSFARLAPSL